MSWIEKELRRRTAEPQPAIQKQPQVAPGLDRIKEFWTEIQAVNGALPDGLQLRLESASSATAAPEEINVREWLRAPNGAALGFAGQAIRYSWPEKRKNGSNNFWMLWNPSNQRFVVQQRVNSKVPPSISDYRFSKVSAEKIVKLLVLGKRIKPKSVAKSSFWVF